MLIGTECRRGDITEKDKISLLAFPRWQLIAPFREHLSPRHEQARDICKFRHFFLMLGFCGVLNRRSTRVMGTKCLRCRKIPRFASRTIKNDVSSVYFSHRLLSIMKSFELELLRDLIKITPKKGYRAPRRPRPLRRLLCLRPLCAADARQVHWSVLDR